VHAIGFTNTEDRDDAAVFQASAGLRLALEALKESSRQTKVRVQDLQGNASVQRELPRLPHHTHAAAADRALGPNPRRKREAA